MVLGRVTVVLAAVQCVGGAYKSSNLFFGSLLAAVLLPLTLLVLVIVLILLCVFRAKRFNDDRKIAAYKEMEQEKEQLASEIGPESLTHDLWS